MRGWVQQIQLIYNPVDSKDTKQPECRSNTPTPVVAVVTAPPSQVDSEAGNMMGGGYSVVGHY